MNVLLLVRSLTTGGAERRLSVLAKGLKEQGHEVSVISFYCGGYFQEELEHSEIKVRSLQKKGRWDIFPPLWKLIQLIRDEPFEFLYSFSPLSNIALALMKPLIPNNRHIVWGIAASDLDWSLYTPLARVSWHIEKYLSPFADMIVANSYAGKKYAINNGFSDRAFEVILNGFDTDKFCILPNEREKLRQKWKVKGSEKLIGIVARLDPIKHHQSFLNAASVVLKKHENVQFVCIGDGPDDYKSELLSLSKKLELGRKMIWAGNHSDMPAVYNALDIMVSCSYSEGLSNVIGEAMACGTPCVVTDVGDSSRVVGECGLVVSGHDPYQLAEVLGQCMNREWARTSVSERILKCFSLDQFIQKTENMFHSLESTKLPSPQKNTQ